MTEKTFMHLADAIIKWPNFSVLIIPGRLLYACEPIFINMAQPKIYPTMHLLQSRRHS